MIVALLALLAAAPSPGPRVYDPTHVDDLVALAEELKRHVAHVTVEATAPPGVLGYETERDGFAVVIGPKHLAVLHTIVERAKKIAIEGPSGRAVAGRIALYDPERRVAIVEAKEPLSLAGLSPARLTAKEDRTEDQDIFALVATTAEAGVITGALKQTGDEPEDEGHPRVTLELQNGMPVFDSEARLIGFARALAWDKDKQLLVPPEIIAAARTATGAAERDALDRKKLPRTPPWWGR